MFSKEAIVKATEHIFQQMEQCGWLTENYQEMEWKDAWTDLGQKSLDKIRKIAEDLGFGVEEGIDILRLKSINEALHVFDPKSSHRFSFGGRGTAREFAEFWVLIADELYIREDLLELYAFVLIAIRHGKLKVHPYKK